MTITTLYNPGDILYFAMDYQVKFGKTSQVRIEFSTLNSTPEIAYLFGDTWIPEKYVAAEVKTLLENLLKIPAVEYDELPF